MQNNLVRKLKELEKLEPNDLQNVYSKAFGFNFYNFSNFFNFYNLILNL